MVQEEILKWACPAFKGCLAHAYRDLCSCLCSHVIALHVGHIGLKDPGWLCKLLEYLMSHPWPWNPEVPALGVLRQFAEALGGGNDNSYLLPLTQCYPDQPGLYLGWENCKASWKEIRWQNTAMLSAQLSRHISDGKWVSRKKAGWDLCHLNSLPWTLAVSPTARTYKEVMRSGSDVYRKEAPIPWAIY